MALSILEKAKLQGETSSLKSQIKTGGLNILEKAKLQKQWSANIKTLKGGGVAKQIPPTSTVVADFVAGKHSASAASAFLSAIDSVVAAGGSLDDVKAGSKLWLEARQAELKQQEAA